MKKQSLTLISAGGIITGVGLTCRIFLHLSGDVTDFITGFGVAFILGAFFIDARSRMRKAKA